MRHEPAPRRPSSGETRPRSGRTSRLRAIRRASARDAPRDAAAEQELERRRGRELGRAPSRPTPSRSTGQRLDRLPSSAPSTSASTGVWLGDSREALGQPSHGAPRARRVRSPDLEIGRHHAGKLRNPGARLGRHVGGRPKGRPSGSRKAFSGQPALPFRITAASKVEGVDVGTLLAVDLDVDEVLVHLRSRSRPRRIRAPSRGTSGRPSSRSRERSACPPRAHARTPPSPHGYQSTGLSRAGAGRDVSFASRFGIG